jgi:hypothetical protein
MRRALVIAGAALALAVAAGAYSEYGPRPTPTGQPPLVRLNAANFKDLQERFNQAPDRVRVLALLSPT